MGALSLLSCAVACVVATASASEVHELTRRESFTSSNGMKMVPMPASGSPSDGSITGLMNDQDIEYLVNITLGGSVFTLQIDTGSSDVVVFPDKPIKTTSVLKDLQVNETYGIGTYSGPVAFAKLEFAGYAVESQVFLNTTTLDDPSLMSNGVLGFDIGIPPGNTSPLGLTLAENYGPVKGIEMGRNVIGNIFAQNPDLGNFTVMIFGRTDDGEGAGEGYLGIGEYPEELKDSFSKVNYVDTVRSKPSSFVVYVDGISLNGKSLPLNSTVRRTPHGKAVANLDTGTSSAQIPQDMSDAIYRSIPGAYYSDDLQHYVVPCVSSGAPNISFKVENQNIYIHPLDLTQIVDLRPAGLNYTICIETYSGTSSVEDTGEDFLLGDVFLRNVYTSFYYGSYNTTGSMIKSPAVKMIPVNHDVDATYSDFLTRRRQKLASLPPEATRAQFEQFVGVSSGNSSAGDDASADVETIASGVSSNSDSTDGSPYKALLNKLNSFAPIVFGLLGAIVVALLGLLGVGLALCIRRGRTVGAARSANTFYSPVPAPERFKEPVPEYRDEENARYDH
ncbi:unnamed protein product [Peniophora sp. CBMAI 1063]|nr:unnamed protein product [Peniophora sp. CBMAI 1063]